MTMTFAITLQDRLGGAVLGHLVGDALGVPYEFGAPVPADRVVFGATGTWGRPAGTWSDDGGLMLALLDSLLTAGFDPDDQGRRALAWYRDGAYTPGGEGRFDVGNATREALDRIEAGVPAATAGAAHEWSKSNGSLMRILPLALVERDLPDARLMEHAGLASGVTHATVEARVTCGVYALVVRRLLTGQRPEPALEGAFAAARAACAGLADAAAALEALAAHAGRSGSAFVLDAFWSAWDAFAGAADYETAVRRAVAYGNDTDTTAAIAGGLAGAHWGWGGIPVAWRRGLRGAETWRPLIDRLVATTGAMTSESHPLRVDWIPLDGVPGLDGPPARLGITFLPGKKRVGGTGPWWRDLALDLARLRELGVDNLFLLVGDDELRGCHVPELPSVLEAAGTPALLRHPIIDVHVPADSRRFRADLRTYATCLVRDGESVAIACRGGLDRSGMAAACLLVELGLPAAEAMDRVQLARRGAITNPGERAYVEAWPGPAVPASRSITSSIASAAGRTPSASAPSQRSSASPR